MNKNEFVDEITQRATEITALFMKDHQYVMLLAAVEHKLSAAQIGTVAAEYASRPKQDKDVVAFTAWDTGVKDEEKFSAAVDLRLASRENQKRAKKAGMTIREELNDDIFAELIEASQNYHNAIKYYNDRMVEGTSPMPDDARFEEFDQLIHGLNSEFARFVELYRLTEVEQ